VRLSLRLRIAALATICIYALLVFTAALLVAHNFGLFLACIPTAALLAYGAWLGFTGLRKRAMIGVGLVILSFAALVVEFGYFLRGRDDWRAVLMVLVLSVLYVVLIGFLRREYWREMRRSNESTKTTAQFHNPFLIINPKAGNGRAVKAHLDEQAKKQGITVIFTKKGDDLESVARRAVRRGADVLGVSGGDGSLGAVAKVAIEQQLPIVVLPGGTRCHFARDLGLDPKRITDALAGFHGVERLVDTADINGRIFLNNASFGLYADIVDSPGYREHKVQASRNVLRSIVNGTKDTYDLRFRRDKFQVDKAVQVLVGVNSYETFNVFELGHRERLDEGVLQVTAITQLNDETMRELLSTISIDKLGKTDAYPNIFQWTRKSFSITNSTGRIVAGVDGEREEYATPVTIRVKPLALHIFVPAEGLRNRPKNPFSLFVIHRIWEGMMPTSKI